jgi:hypothetical protein
MTNPEALTFWIPKGLFRPVAGKLYIYTRKSQAVSLAIRMALDFSQTSSILRRINSIIRLHSAFKVCFFTTVKN